MATTTVDLAQNFQSLGLGEGWSWLKGSWWLDTPENFDLRAITARLIELQARFVAITATPEAEAIRLDYQWDLNGQLLSFKVPCASKLIASIVDLVPGADWAERETYEYFAVEFIGRTSMEPLMLRTGDPVGVHMQKEAAQ